MGGRLVGQRISFDLFTLQQMNNRKPRKVTLMNTRRQFLIRAPLGVLVVAAACRKSPPTNSHTPTTPGAPPTFGTGTGSGPEVTPATFAEAERLMQVTMTPAERQQAADSWRQSLAPYLERRTGPRKLAIAATDSPATLWNPMLPGIAASPSRDQFVRSNSDGAALPSADDAGAVLIAKLSLGALALNDIWFGGQTMNPWLLEEGASGSSAGPGAATAAALVAFSIGSETGGSIVSPAMRCGVTGLRPTFGRVPRTGAMTLCWSLDKLGPMTRTIEDAMLVLHAISGPDAGDASSVPSRLDFDATAPVAGLKVGYIAQWMKDSPATDVDRAAMETMKKLKMELKEVKLPDWPYSSLMPILFAEGAASFEELALNNELGSLKVQVKDAWPNLFRQARFLSAVDLVQADRFRRKVALEMARVFRDVDLLIVPSLRDEQLTITNFTGHPSLTLRAGFVEVSEARSDWAPDPANPLPKFSPQRRVPHGITILGRLFEDGLIGQVGLALERAFGVAGERPAGF